jgi:hypothetical protein
MTNLRTLLWVYLWLLLFEGALRKWIVPALDAPLLIVRDPLVVWIYIQALRQHLSFRSVFFLPNLALAVITAVLSLLFGEATPFITVYGLRTDYLQIPLIFLIPQIFNRDDVVAMGRFILYAAIPIAILVVIQFKSPQGSFINKGAMNTWYGTVRPSGTFSFIAGLVSYFALVSSFIFYGFFQGRVYKTWLLLITTFFVLLASGVSGSRGCLVSSAVVAATAVVCVLATGKRIKELVLTMGALAVLFPILLFIPTFQDGVSQLTMRFQDGAANGEDTQGFIARYANTMMQPLTTMGDVPIFGSGLGLGTNAAAGLLTGDREFLGAEDEWGRLIFESGPIFGTLLCLFRAALTVAIGWSAFTAFRRGQMLPILIFAACGLTILNGQWGVPTTLGFAIFGAGLTLAACVEPEYDDEDEEEHEEGHAEDEPEHSRSPDAVS